MIEGGAEPKQCIARKRFGEARQQRVHPWTTDDGLVFVSIA